MQNKFYIEPDPRLFKSSSILNPFNNPMKIMKCMPKKCQCEGSEDWIDLGKQQKTLRMYMGVMAGVCADPNEGRITKWLNSIVLKFWSSPAWRSG